jgi:hypothetical protein
MLELTSYPAKQGDALWIRWGERADPHHLVVDMGTEPIGRDMRPRLEALAKGGGALDLVVITHVDADHIGGVLTSLAEANAIPGLDVHDVWFNGFEHLRGEVVHRRNTLESMGPAQGERLSDWLREQPWNEAFDRGPVTRPSVGALPSRELHDGLTLTVLGPTPQRLERFIDTWKDTVEEALDAGRLDPGIVSPGLEAFGTTEPPELASDADLLELATRNTREDASVANGSSIALLLEYEDRSILLSGDAFSTDLIDAIGLLSPGRPLELDLFKLSHHGSKGSTSRALVEAVESPVWLFSTDGSRFKHPDAEAVARVLAFGRPTDAILAFNVPSAFNEWWENEAWMDRFGYSVLYGDATDGLTVDFLLD